MQICAGYDTFHLNPESGGLKFSPQCAATLGIDKDQVISSCDEGIKMVSKHTGYPVESLEKSSSGCYHT